VLNLLKYQDKEVRHNVNTTEGVTFKGSVPGISEIYGNNRRGEPCRKSLPIYESREEDSPD
jgi:hypothetical protein